MSTPLLVLAALLGLIWGSFLNVVIHRLPRMLEAAWQAEWKLWHDQQSGTDAPAAAGTTPPRYNLAVPGSHCPHCSAPLRWFHNIPLLSWLGLRGRSACCQQRIDVRYPLVELACAVLAAVCMWRWGPHWPALAAMLFGSGLLCLTWIDHDTGYLPDQITLPLLWAGLLASALHWTPATLPQSVWGAALGYSVLWLVAQIFLWISGRHGMGNGDFKLLAAIGAWLGWPLLPPVLLLASTSGAVYGIWAQATGRLARGQAFAFGPFLCLGAGLAWCMGTSWLTALVAH